MVAVVMEVMVGMTVVAVGGGGGGGGGDDSDDEHTPDEDRVLYWRGPYNVWIYPIHVREITGTYFRRDGPCSKVWRVS